LKNYTWQADLNSQHDGNLLGDFCLITFHLTFGSNMHHPYRWIVKCVNTSVKKHSLEIYSSFIIPAHFPWAIW